jgi:TolB-like protein
METGNAELVRRQLEKILSSERFAHNDRLRGFLGFVVEQELSGLGDQLKESVIGVEVFGRQPDYNVRRDSVVRTEAGRLRARLLEYYANGGASDTLVIELPKGGYKPVFKAVVHPESPAQKTPRSTRLWLGVGIVCMVVSVMAVGWWRFQHRNTPVPIAVLPLINLNQDSADDYFADGLTGEIIRNLSIIDGLVVRSQTSSFGFKGKTQNVRETGKQLRADYIVEGSVLRAGRTLRINAHLVRVRDDFPMWSGRYDRQLTDVFAIQDEISRGIVNSLRLKLGRGRRRYETSAEAYDLYLRARAFEIKSTAAGRNKSAGLYEQAIAKDPSFAPAFAGLGAAYAYRTGEDRINWAGPDRVEEMSRMREIAEKAVQLDPLLAEAHEALGMVQARDAQWEQAEKSFHRAIELAPGSVLARTDFAIGLLLPLGRIEEAVAQFRLAEKSDPVSPDVQSNLAYALFSAGRVDEAAAHCKKPCPRALILQGRAAEAIPILEEQSRSLAPAATPNYLLGYAYALAGRREDAERIAAIHPRLIERAAIFVALGENGRAFEALNSAIPMGPVRIGRNLTWPEFAPLRGDPRLKALRNKLGIPES